MDEPQTFDERGRGAPYCGDCGYELTGAIDSSKCPECGRPLVEVLMRPQLEFKGGKRWRSKQQIFGMPVVDIAFGPHGTEKYGKARGFIAIGDTARGFIALGGRAVGVVAAGGFAAGGFTFGGMSLGLVSGLGGCATGLLAGGGMAIGGLSQGGGAVGIVAQGGGAIGVFARGGGAIGRYVIGANGVADPEAVAMFDTFSWYFGSGSVGIWSLILSIAIQFMLGLGVAALLGLMALQAMRAPEAR